MRKGTARRVRGRTGDEVSADGLSLGTQGDNVYAESVDAGHGKDPRARKIVAMAGLLAVLLVGALLLGGGHSTTGSLAAEGATKLNQIAFNLGANLQDLLALFTGYGSQSIVGHVTIYFVVALAGAGLALSGAVYQGSFGNALVSPSTLGVMTGGSVGTVVWVALFVGGVFSTTGSHLYSFSHDEGLLGFWGGTYGLALCSFIGCFAVVGCVLLVMRVAGARHFSGVMLIITGQIVGAVLGTISGAITYYYAVTDPEVTELLQLLSISSFYRGYSFEMLGVLLAACALTFLVIYRLYPKMMVLSFDKAEQRAMGVNTRLVTFAAVGLCTLLTAIIISFCGAVGFVGFLVPHLARRFVGPNFKYLLPASALLGAIFVLGVYVAAQAFGGDTAANLTGIYISLFGAVVFLVQVVTGKGVQRGAFQ